MPAWMGVCSYLGVDVCVAIKSAVLHSSCAADRAPMICVQLHDQHCSAIIGERMGKTSLGNVPLEPVSILKTITMSMVGVLP